MSHLRFRIAGGTRRQARWVRKRVQPHPLQLMVPLKLALGIAGTAAAGALLPNMIDILAGTPSAVVGGKLVLGHQVHIIRDVSGSMQGIDSVLNTHIGRMRASEMGLVVDSVDGFGVAQRNARNLLFGIRRVLDEQRRPDAVYAFSDFEATEEGCVGGGILRPWESDARGYAALRGVLNQHQVRLYLGTIECTPPSELLAIARETGGGLIEIRP